MGVIERKEREKEQRRQQILEAGKNAFLKYGYENTTMEHIANECEMSRATIYLYFKNKEDLIQSIIIYSLDILYKMMSESINTTDEPEQKLMAMGYAYLEFYKKHRGYFKILNYMEDHGSKTMQNMECATSIIDKSEKVWNLAVGVYDEGKKLGIFNKEINSYQLAIMIWAASNGIIQLMDHILYAHKAVNNIGSEMGFNSEFLKLNYEKMLLTLWDYIVNSTKNFN
jgi:TetR/AcrR family transcriptional regulator